MTQLTQEDREIILNDLLNALATSCRKIEQLTQVNTLIDSNLFELAGGKKVSFATIKDVFSGIVSDSAKNIKNVLIQDIKNLIGKENGIAPLGIDKNVPYSNLPYICVRFDRFVTIASSKAITSDETFVPPNGSVVSYNSVVRCFVLLTSDGTQYYRAWKGMQAWGYFNGNGATPHHGILYWDGCQLYTFDNKLGLQEVFKFGNSTETILPDNYTVMSKSEAVSLVEKEFETPLKLD